MQKAKSKKYIIATTIVVAAIATLLTWWLAAKDMRISYQHKVKLLYASTPQK